MAHHGQDSARLMTHHLMTHRDTRHQVWRSYLAKGQYDTALLYCRDLTQREHVCHAPDCPIRLGLLVLSCLVVYPVYLKLVGAADMGAHAQVLTAQADHYLESKQYDFCSPPSYVLCCPRMTAFTGHACR